MSTLFSNGGGCIHCTGEDSVISSSDKDSFCVQCFQDLFEKRVNVTSASSGGSALPAYLKSKPPPVPPKPGKNKDKELDLPPPPPVPVTPPPQIYSPLPGVTPPLQTYSLLPGIKPEQNKEKELELPPPKSQSPLPGFVCSSCDTPLHGKTVESKNGKVFCKECYVKVVQKPCHQCRELIKPADLQIVYQNQPYHQNCFRCSKCDVVIGEKNFCNADRGIFCDDCYFETSGKNCKKCKQVLTSTGYMFRDQPWHKACFTCEKCQKPMDNANQEIFCKDDKPYCSPCYDELYLEKCNACAKPMRGEIVEYQSKQYHEECFCCNHCNSPIGAFPFFPRENSVYCQTCFVINFGKMCKKCGLTISPENAMGIVYLEEHWHRDCFICSNPKCEKSLVGIPIHSSKDQNLPFCAECYDELFAKRCAACTKIISGVIGSKFITYEDRHFHTDCFVCKLCQTNLANRKFCPDGNDILCGPCLKYMRV